MTLFVRNEVLLNSNSENSKNAVIIAAQALRKEYARMLCKFEIKVATGERHVLCESKRAVQEYAMSTSNKRFFMVHNCLARLEGKYISVEETRKLIGVSRAAMDTMCNECHAAGWIFLDKNKRGHRRMKAADITLECWLDYADFINSLVDEMDFVHLNSSRRVASLLINK